MKNYKVGEKIVAGLSEAENEAHIQYLKFGKSPEIRRIRNPQTKTESIFLKNLKPKNVLRLKILHKYGYYFCNEFEHFQKQGCRIACGQISGKAAYASNFWSKDLRSYVKETFKLLQALKFGKTITFCDDFVSLKN